MTVARGFAITIVSGVVGAGLGTLLGFLLGRYSPDYYRFVFRIPRSENLDPIQAGIGLGVTQGLAAGLVVGLVIVVTVAWCHVRALASSKKSVLESGKQ